MGEMRPVLGLLLLVVGCGNGEGGREKGNYDVLLRGGWIVDGSGNPRYRGGVAIAGDRIAGLGFLAGAQARETLDVSGLAVAPGFIDMMGQSEINVLIDNRVLSKVTQGVTTEVTGEGGSVAPLTDRLVMDDSDAMKKWHYREDWRDLDGYFVQLAKQDRKSTRLNSSHGYISYAVFCLKKKKPSNCIRAAMQLQTLLTSIHRPSRSP